MRILIKWLPLLLVSVLFFGGCQKTEGQKVKDSYTFTDDLGREVSVDHPVRVAALLGSYAEIWQLSGGEICAVVDDAWDDMGLELAEDTVNLGNTKEPGVEKLLAARPDFILASARTKADLDMMDTLESAKIPTAYFYTVGFEDYLRMLKICTEITGREELYEKNGLEVQKQIEEVVKESKERLEGAEAPKILMLRASASSIRAKNSEGDVLAEMLAALGCVNIADSESSLLENLNVEYIIRQDPDYIFTVQSGDDVKGTEKALTELFTQNPAWASLSAVKEGRVFMMEKRLYNLKPNARWGEAYEKLEEILSEGTVK